MTSFTDPEGHSTTYAYDALSRNTSISRPLGQSVQYVYDGRGRLDYLITTRGQKSDYSYETWGPLKEEKRFATSSVSTPDRTITYARDDDGNVLTVSDDVVQTAPVYTNTYDALGRLYDETVGYLPSGNRVPQHRYDRYGNRKELTLVDGSSVTSTFEYNKLNQVTTATLAGAAVSLGYFANDDLQNLTLPGGVSRSYTYKANGPIDTISVAGSSGTFAQFGYSYDDVRNVVTATDADGTHTFTYDGLNRLTQASHPVGAGLADESYTYDRAGNRKDAANPTLWSFDNNNRITQAGALSYGSDADGNLATRSDGATFTHDARSRLVQFSKGATSSAYLYDSAGRRIRKTVNGSVSWLIWDGTRLIAEFDAAGNRTRRYAYLPSTAVATQFQDGSGTYYVHGTNVQAPRVLTDTTGAKVWSARYQAYGDAVVNEDPDANSVSVTFNQKLPGPYADSESALSYNYFRDYDPATGRYAQGDPVGVDGGSNIYAYALGNPLSFTDALGLAPGDCYPTQDAAAANAINDINYQSIQENREYAGRLYKNADGTFSYSRPNPGSVAGSSPGPLTPTTVGDYHTHGGPDPRYDSEHFSGTAPGATRGDIPHINADAVGRPGYKGYVGTPSGVIKSYDPSTGQIKNLPYPAPHNGDAIRP